MTFEIQFNLFLRALTRYIEAPSPTLTLDLQHKAMSLEAALRQEQTEMERRITENVLKRLSVLFESRGAIAEIESLREAIERIGK